MPRLRQNKTYQTNTPAKLNLSLEVLGRRPDGFHELRTVMSSIRIYDTLRLELTEDPAITFSLTKCDRHSSSHQDIPTDGENLVVRALELLRQDSGAQLALNRGLKVDLVKRIPSQAGLGGGSSDAGAALVLGNQAWDLGLGVDELSTLGERLGSDVPFFVHTNFARFDKSSKQTTSCRAANYRTRECRAAMCKGRGDRITPLNQVGGIPCVVIKPNLGLATPEVFGAYQSKPLKQDTSDLRSSETRGSESQMNSSNQVANRLASADWKNLGEVMGNALQMAAMQVAPSLQEIPKILSKLPVIAHQLSGSGSAYFALCRTAIEARRVAAILRAHEVGRLYVTNTC